MKRLSLIIAALLLAACGTLPKEPVAEELLSRPYNHSAEQYAFRIIESPTQQQVDGIAIAVQDIDKKGRVVGTAWQGGSLQLLTGKALRQKLPDNSLLRVLAKQQKLPSRYAPQKECVQDGTGEEVCTAVPSHARMILLFTKPDSKRDFETLFTPVPNYPPLSEENGEEGISKVRVEFLPDGKTGRITIKQSSGYRRLDISAKNAAKSIKIIPVIENGKGWAVAGSVDFKFSLSESK